MAECRENFEEVGRLAGLLLEGALGVDDQRRLEHLLLADPAAVAYYHDYIDLHSLLYWQYESPNGDAVEISVGEAAPEPAADASRPAAPIVLNLSSASHASPGWFAPGGMLFSYGVSAMVVAVGLLVAWTATISQHHEMIARDAAVETIAETKPADAASEPEPEMRFVGRITGMIDCHWADPATEAFDGASVPVGRRFALAAGLLEITYQSGAKIILQGPCSYKVDADDGGFLALGKLTAKVEKKVASEAATTDHSPLFVVRTPTAIVTDVGTEFGVEVDKSGASKTHVFRGKVEVRLAESGANADRAVPLGENESARVEAGPARTITVVRESSRPVAFARNMPKRVRIALSNTGANLKEGQPDPHWQLVASSADPQWKAQPAFVAAIPREWWLPNEIAQSQWISGVGDFSDMPGPATYVFRTTFDLKDMLHQTAVLRGRFMADNHVQAIRLNGQNLDVPEHSYGGPFFNWYEFKATRGFLEGVNTLEIEVFNGGDANPRPTSPMGCRVELEGFAHRHWKTSENATNHPEQPGKEVRRP